MCLINESEYIKDIKWNFADLWFIFVLGIIPQNVTGKVSLRASYEALDDKQLLERLRREDRDAFACIYRRYHAELYTFAMKYMKNRPDAEDVVQQVFIKLWMIREALVVTSNLRGYLFTMTKHQVMNYIRNSNNALQLNYKIVQQQPQYDDDLYMYAEKRHMTDLLRYAIETLPPRQRTVAEMRCEGYTNQEIAQRMNLSIHTVNTHYRECMKTLKGYFASIVKILIIILLFRL